MPAISGLVKPSASILYHEYIDCINTGKDSGSGIYEVKNYTVPFNYIDGRKINIVFSGNNYDKKNLSRATLTMSANEDEMHKQ